MKKHYLAAVIVIAVVIASYLLFDQTRKKRPSGPLEPVTLGIAMQPNCVLPLLAHHHGFFKDEGLNVTLKSFPSGIRALNEGLLTGEADIITMTEMPVVAGLLNKQPLRVLASIATSGNLNRIVARKDRGIKTPDDLRGKTIATQKSSAVHYFLHLFLLNHGIDSAQSKIVYMKAEELVDALANGSIDAFSMREPYVSQALEKLGNNAAVFEMPGLYVQAELLVATAGFDQARPDTVRKFLRAMVRAETYAKEHPREAMETVASLLKIAPKTYQTLWKEIDPKVRLDQSLLMLLESQARWAAQSDMAPGATLPNFLGAISADALIDVKPDAVTIIR